jgi:hypothetical protein
LDNNDYDDDDDDDDDYDEFDKNFDDEDDEDEEDGPDDTYNTEDGPAYGQTGFNRDTDSDRNEFDDDEDEEEEDERERLQRLYKQPGTDDGQTFDDDDDDLEDDETAVNPPGEQNVVAAAAGRNAAKFQFDQDTPGSGHFMAYFVTMVVFVVVGYVGYHNRQKIIAFVVEGRNARRRRGTGSGGPEYKKLLTNVEEVAPSTMEKGGPPQGNFIY